MNIDRVDFEEAIKKIEPASQREPKQIDWLVYYLATFERILILHEQIMQYVLEDYKRLSLGQEFSKTEIMSKCYDLSNAIEKQIEDNSRIQYNYKNHKNISEYDDLPEEIKDLTEKQKSNTPIPEVIFLDICLRATKEYYRNRDEINASPSHN